MEVLENLGPIDESTARQPANKVAAVSVDYVDKDKDDDQVFEDLTMISVSEGYENNALLPWSWEGLKQAQQDDPDISRVLQLLQSSQVKPRWEDVALKSTDVKTLWRMWSQLSIRDGLLKRRFESADIDVLEFREGFLSVAHGGMVGGQFGRTKTAAIYNSVACILADMVLRYGCLFQFETVRTLCIILSRCSSS